MPAEKSEQTMPSTRTKRRIERVAGLRTAHKVPNNMPAGIEIGVACGMSRSARTMFVSKALRGGAEKGRLNQAGASSKAVTMAPITAALINTRRIASRSSVVRSTEPSIRLRHRCATTALQKNEYARRYTQLRCHG